MERTTRLGKKRRPLRKIFFFLVILAASAVVGFFLLGDNRSLGNRKTVVLVGDPVTIVSYDKSNDSFLILTIPASAVVDSVHGYGQYSLLSLWKLGSIESREGVVLSESIEELLAFPVPWYIGRKHHAFLGQGDAMQFVKSVFSLRAAPSFFRGMYTTNMSPKAFLVFSWAFSRRRPDLVRVVDVQSSLVAQSLPDGTTTYVADPDRIDQIVGNLFEDAGIRKEGLTVAVFNTTPIASLGSRVSRLFTHAGILVVVVGNDQPTVHACTIHGEKKQLSTRTAEFIARLYGCKKEEGAEPRADLTVRIGTAYQSRFIPFKTK